jgi:sulfonate transport system permease protein
MTSIALPLAKSPLHPRLRLGSKGLGLLSTALVLLAWWAVSAAGWFPPEIFVSPSAVLSAAAELWRDGELPVHLVASFRRLGLGAGFGIGAGLLFGIAAALSRTLEDYTASTFTALRTVPSIAFIPILILIFGIGETFKLLVIAKAIFFPVALATISGVRGIPLRFLEVAAIYRLPLLSRLRRVVLPAALPPIVTGLRLGLGRSWGVLVAAELVASEDGIGQMMEFARQMFRLDVVMVGVVITGLVGFTLDRSLRGIEARLSRWRVA